MQTGSRLFTATFVQILLILVLGLLVYSNIFAVPFIYDDDLYIRDNPAIKSFQFFKDTEQVNELNIDPDIKNNFILRPLTYFTFAVNYNLHGTDVFGYHLVNLLLHLASAILVYFLFKITLQTGINSSGDTGDKSGHELFHFLPLFAGLLFVCHPLQTQGVTYIVQRFVPLATLFYLVALVLYIQFRRASSLTSRALTYVFSLVATVLAMESKEIAFTLPVIICIYEFIFLKGHLSGRVVRLVPFLLTMAIIPQKLSHLQAPAMPVKASQFSKGINLVNFSDLTTYNYLITQFGVITTYLRLLLLPVGQKFIYDYPLQTRIFSLNVLLPLALLSIILATGLCLLLRSKNNLLYKIIAFGIFWFFISISVESSVIPISDLLVEHRAYLPSVGFIIAVLTATLVIFNKLPWDARKKAKSALCLLVLIIACLSTATFARNTIWQDKIGFWEESHHESPNLWRPVSYLSAAYMAAGRSDEALSTMITAIGRNRASLKLSEYFELKKLCTRLGRPEIAFEIIYAKKDSLIAGYKNEIRVNPGMGHPHYKLGMVYLELNHLDDAVREFNKAVAIRADKAEVYLGLTRAYLAQRNNDLAAKSLEIAEKLAPKNPEILKYRSMLDDWASE